MINRKNTKNCKKKKNIATGKNIVGKNYVAATLRQQLEDKKYV